MQLVDNFDVPRTQVYYLINTDANGAATFDSDVPDASGLNSFLTSTTTNNGFTGAVIGQVVDRIRNKVPGSNTASVNNIIIQATAP